jgi:phosphohistidine phosphatase SixA
VIHFVKNFSNDLKRVMCVGHNPAFTQAVVYFSGKDFDHLPTAAWAHLKFKETKWSSVQEGTLTLGLPKKILK